MGWLLVISLHEFFLQVYVLVESTIHLVQPAHFHDRYLHEIVQLPLQKIYLCSHPKSLTNTHIDGDGGGGEGDGDGG